MVILDLFIFVARWTWGFVCVASINISHFWWQSSCGSSSAIILVSVWTKMWLGSRYRICTRTSCSHIDPLGVRGWNLCCSYWTGRIFFPCCMSMFIMKLYMNVFWKHTHTHMYICVYIYILLLYIRNWFKIRTLSLINPDLIKSSHMSKVRVPVGRLTLELPAGMLDDDKGDFVGTAVREVPLSLSLMHTHIY